MVVSLIWNNSSWSKNGVNLIKNPLPYLLAIQNLDLI